MATDTSMRRPSPGEEKLIENIKDVVNAVTKPRFDTIDQRLATLDTLDKDVKSILKILRSSPPPASRP